MLIEEQLTERSQALPLLGRYIRRAHEEGVSRFRDFLGDPLDPRRAATHRKALDFYPKGCESLTLEGFFGEIIAGLLVELYFPHRTRWHVPAFSFYAHELLFQELIAAASLDHKPRRSLGHFGDDCLAFLLPLSKSSVERVLLCEAKCTTRHRSTLIANAHAKLSAQPIEVTAIWLQLLIESLHRRGDETSERWAQKLQVFKDSQRFSEQFRDDVVSYTHGARPKRKGTTWIPTSGPHHKYKANRRLEAFEVHFSNVQDLVALAYAEAYP